MNSQLSMYDLFVNRDLSPMSYKERYKAFTRQSNLSLGIDDCPICGSTRIVYYQMGYIYPNIYSNFVCNNCGYRVHGEHMTEKETARKWVEEYKKIKAEALNG